MTRKTITLKTADGCTIQLHRLVLSEPMRHHPVLLVHGFAANAHMWNPPTQDGHIAAYLAHQGFRVYTIDLRFRTGPPDRDWDADDYVFYDIPRAIQFMQLDSASAKIHWIGHSMGGLLGYMYQALNGPTSIASLTTLGSPGFAGAGRHTHLVKLSKAIIRLSAMAVQSGRLDLLPRKLMAKLVAMSFYAANPKNPFLKKAHIHNLRLKNFLGNISYGESMQMCFLAEKKGLISPKYHFNYQEMAPNIQAPLLAFAGDRDFIVPPNLVKMGFDATRTPAHEKKFVRLGKSRGERTSYGHLDLIMGPNANLEIWPLILSWLTEWDTTPRLSAHPNRPQQSEPHRDWQGPPLGPKGFPARPLKLG